MFHIWQ